MRHTVLIVYLRQKMPTRKCSICHKVRKIRLSHTPCKGCTEDLGESPSMDVCCACSCMLTELFCHLMDLNAMDKLPSKEKIHDTGYHQ
jgi:hypothetical protein